METVRVRIPVRRGQGWVLRYVELPDDPDLLVIANQLCHAFRKAELARLRKANRDTHPEVQYAYHRHLASTTELRYRRAIRRRRTTSGP